MPTDKTRAAVFESIVELLRSKLSAAPTAYSGSDLSSEDWGAMLAGSDWHRVGPQIASIATNTLALDATAAARLKEELQANARRNLWNTSVLFIVLKRFRELGIEPIVYKGPALAVGAYKDLAIRDFGDLDLLVPFDQVRAAKRGLLELGFLPWKGFEFGGKKETAFLEESYVLPFTRPGDGATVELHWNILSRTENAGVEIEDFWANPSELRIGSSSVKTFSRPAELVTTCVHGTKHMWERLGVITDVAYVLRACSAADIDEALALARKNGLLQMCEFAVLVSHQVLGTEVPPKFQHALADARLLRRAEWIRKRLPLAIPVDDHPFVGLRWFISSREQLSDRATSVLRLIFCPSYSDRDWVELPDSLYPLYYLLRPLRLFWQVFSSRLRGRRFQPAAGKGDVAAGAKTNAGS